MDIIGGVSVPIKKTNLPRPIDKNKNLSDSKNYGFHSTKDTINTVKSSLKNLLDELNVKYGSTKKSGGADNGHLDIDDGSDETADVYSGFILAGSQNVKACENSINKDSKIIENSIDRIIYVKSIIDKILQEDKFNKNVISILDDQFDKIIDYLHHLLNKDIAKIDTKIKESKDFIDLIKSITNVENDEDEAGKLTLLVKHIYDVNDLKHETKTLADKIKVSTDDLTSDSAVKIFSKIVENIEVVDNDVKNSLNRVSSILRSKGGRIVSSRKNIMTGEDKPRKMTFTQKLDVIKKIYLGVIENYMKEVLEIFNKVGKILYDVSKNINKGVVWNQDLENLIEYFSTFTFLVGSKDDMNNNIIDWFSIVGFKTNPENMARRDDFFYKVNSIATLCKKCIDSQTSASAKSDFEQLAALFKSVVITTDRYADVVKMANDNINKLNFNKIRGAGAHQSDSESGSDSDVEGGLDGGDVNGDNIDITDFINGGFTQDGFNIEEFDNVAMITSESRSIGEYLDKIKLFGNIANIENNLSYISKDIKKYAEGYENILGETIGFKLNDIKKYEVRVINSINNDKGGIGYLLNKYNARVDEIANHNAGAADNLKLRTLFTNKVSKTFLINVCKWQSETLHNFYKTVECIDLFLMNFTISLDANIKDIEKLSDLLENVKINKEWFDADFMKKIVEDAFESRIKFKNSAGALETAVLPKLYKNDDFVKKIKDIKNLLYSITPLKNLLSLFSYMNNMSSYKLLISPKNIYKNLKNYICATQFVCGFNNDKIIDYAPSPNEGPAPQYLKHGLHFIATSIFVKPVNGEEAPAIASLQSIFNPVADFNAVYTGTPGNNDQVAARQAAEKDYLNRLMSNAPLFDVFNRMANFKDDTYFFLLLKAMTSKILTSIGVYKSLKDPKNSYDMIVSPLRMIMGGSNNADGGASSNNYRIEPTVEVSNIELYVRLPLIVEFYKQLFDNGNTTYKNGDRNVNEELETIAYVPDAEGIWSRLIGIIFDKSNFTSTGFYDDHSIRTIINEINTISKNFKSSKDCIMALIYEVNRRYGIVNKNVLTDYYKTIKTFKFDNPNGNDIVNTIMQKDKDILDDFNNVDNSTKLPSDKFYKNSQLQNQNFNVITEEPTFKDDLTLLKDFRKKITDSFAIIQDNNDRNLLANQAFSFNKYIKLYENDVRAANTNSEKLNIVIKAIKDLDSTKEGNNINVIMFYELVVHPFTLLNSLFTNYNNVFTQLKQSFTNAFLDVPANADFVNKLSKQNVDDLINQNVNVRILKPGSSFVKFLSCFNGELTKLKFINNGRDLIFNWENLENLISKLISEIKINLGTFKNMVAKELYEFVQKGVNAAPPAAGGVVGEKPYYSIYELEQLFLNNMIRNDFSSNDELRYSGNSFETINKFLPLMQEDMKQYEMQNMYKQLVFSTSYFKPVLLDDLSYQRYPLFKDVFKTYNTVNRAWSPMNDIILHNSVINKFDLVNNDPANISAQNDFIFKIGKNIDNVKFNICPRSIVERLNVNLSSYVNSLYDSPNKKLYGKLLDNLYNNYILQRAEGFYSIMTSLKVKENVDNVKNGARNQQQNIVAYLNSVNEDPQNIRLNQSGNILYKQDNGVIESYLNSNGRIKFRSFYDYIDVSDNVISDVLVKSIQTVYVRNAKSELPDLKYHLETNFSRLPTYLKNKYRCLLPRYKKKFEKIIEECVFYQNIISSSSVQNVDTTGIYDNPNAVNLNNVLGEDTLEFNGEKVSNSYRHGKVQNNTGYRSNYLSVISQTIECCKNIIKDIENVSDELRLENNTMPVYLEQKEGAVIDYIKYNKSPPFSPASLSISYSVENYKDCTGHYNIMDDKYFYGLRSILDINYSEIKDIESTMPYMSSSIVNYLKYANIGIDSSKLTEQLKDHMKIVKYLYNVKNNLNEYLLVDGDAYRLVNALQPEFLHTEPGRDRLDQAVVAWANAPANPRVNVQKLQDANMSSNIIQDIRTFKLVNKSCGIDIVKIESYLSTSFAETSRNEFYKEIQTCISNVVANGAPLLNLTGKDEAVRANPANRDIGRKQSIIINMVDLNIVPINIHALMREIPLANVYNYAFTYDDIINNSVMFNIVNLANNTIPKPVLNPGAPVIDSAYKSLLDAVNIDSFVNTIPGATNSNNLIYKFKGENVEELGNNVLSDAIKSYIDDNKFGAGVINEAGIPLNSFTPINPGKVEVKNILSNFVISSLLFFSNSQRLVKLKLDDSKNINVKKILQSNDILTQNWDV